MPFKGKMEVALSGYVTYIMETRNKDILEAIKKTLVKQEASHEEKP